MKFYLFSIITISFLGFVSCQTKPKKDVSELSIEDINTKLNETKIYKLKKQIKNSEFDYSKLNDIDAHYGRFPKFKESGDIISAFEPLKGQYNYYQFIAAFKGQSYNDGGPTLIKEFHDILIIKTDSKNKIIDAYQYTLEWSEPPFQNDVYKSTAKNLILTNNLQLNALKFTKTYNGWKEKDNKVNEKGIIRLK